MALAHKVARITINGTMFGGLEQWSTGFYMGATGVDATKPSTAFLDACNTAWKTFFQTNTSYISSQYQTTEIRGALINPDGSTDKSSINHYYVNTPYAGGSVGSALPPQIALVATLITATPRGVGSKGRMFLPGVNVSVDSTGHILGSSVGTITTNLRTFFGAINGSVEQPGVVITASKGSKASLFTDGVNRVVTGVRIGNVYDTQRRRRNALTEVYTTSAAL